MSRFWLVPCFKNLRVRVRCETGLSGRRVGFRANGGVLLLSSCLLAQGGSPTIFFVVPACPSALQECLDSGLCGFYLRSDAHKPDLHVLWRDAPHTIAALCGAVPSPGDSPDAQGCAAALLVGIRRGDNS